MEEHFVRSDEQVAGNNITAKRNVVDTVLLEAVIFLLVLGGVDLAQGFFLMVLKVAEKRRGFQIGVG